jgi:hypothetical protein
VTLEDRSGWEVVAKGASIEIDVLQAALETAGIPSVTLGETIGRIYALGALELGEVRLLVPPDRLMEARELLSDATPIDFPEAD